MVFAESKSEKSELEALLNECLSKENSNKLLPLKLKTNPLQTQNTLELKNKKYITTSEIERTNASTSSINCTVNPNSNSNICISEQQTNDNISNIGVDSDKKNFCKTEDYFKNFEGEFNLEDNIGVFSKKVNKPCKRNQEKIMDQKDFEQLNQSISNISTVSNIHLPESDSEMESMEQIEQIESMDQQPMEQVIYDTNTDEQMSVHADSQAASSIFENQDLLNFSNIEHSKNVLVLGKENWVWWGVKNL